MNPRCNRRLLALSVALVAIPAHAVLFPQRFTDHSLCCGVSGPVGLEGGPVRASNNLTERTVAQSGTTAASSAAAGKISTDSTPIQITPSPSSATGPTSSLPMKPPEEVDGYLKLGFDRLASFKYSQPPPDPAAKPAPAPQPSTTAAASTPPSEIPAEIRQLDGRKAMVTGFMLATRMDEKDNTLVKEMLLVRDPMMCCYGVIPQMNEWIVVKMTKPVPYIPDVPVSLFGKLRVKEMYEEGYMTGIYLLEGEKAAAVKS